MSWDTALPGRLLANETIAELIGREDGVASIDWDVRRPGAPVPALVLQIISDARPQNHDGLDGVWWSRVQLRTLANERAMAKALGEAAIAALVPAGEFEGTTFLRGFVDAVRGAGEQGETRYLYGDTIDFILWHTN